MAKRRFRQALEKSPEELTPQERRERRKSDRRKGSSRRERGPGSIARRAAIVAIPTGVIAIVVVVLVFFSPFAAPCIQLSSIPSSSGIPAFPPSATTDFSITWCPGGFEAFHFHPKLVITIHGTAVAIPAGIGINSTYPGGKSCILPIHTHPGDAQGDSAGILHVESPWPYRYTLGDFFSVWADSLSGVYVNQSFPNQPIAYSNTSILGFQAAAGSTVRLTVDGTPSQAGPSLDLSPLDFEPAPYPPCLFDGLGTGHTIQITFGA